MRDKGKVTRGKGRGARGEGRGARMISRAGRAQSAEACDSPLLLFAGYFQDLVLPFFPQLEESDELIFAPFV